MKISFYSNYLTHHQIPFCNEMYNLLKDDFTFVSTENMDMDRKNSGWDIKNRYEYEIKSFESKKLLEKALDLSRESDVIIHGSAPELFVKERMKCQATGITFRYSERIYKKGRWRAISPRGIIKRINTYFKYRRKNLYMLCASAYTAGDLILHGSYIGKCYKWGYFTEVIEYDIDVLLKNKGKNTKPRLLWVGRFLDWKHPDHAIKVAHMLKNQGQDFTLDIIGSGDMEKDLNSLVENYQLSDRVRMLGSMTPEKVRVHMEAADIYLFTSDFNEGWGAVLNESMNSGCAVVASHAIGSVPYLIQEGINGLVYKNGDINSLYTQVKLLVNNRALCRKLGRKAYETIIKEWNAKVAVERMLLLIVDLNNKGYSEQFQSGPCSKAEIINNNWYGE